MKRFARELKSSGITREEFMRRMAAEGWAISESTFSRWLGGSRSPYRHPMTAAVLARVFASGSDEKDFIGFQAGGES